MAKTGLFGNAKNDGGKLNSATYIRDGVYVVRIDGVLLKKNRKGIKKVIIEMTVVEVLDDGTRGGHHVGEQISQVLDPSWDYFMSLFRNLTEAGLRFSWDNMSPEEVEEMCESVLDVDQQPMRGVILTAYAKQVATKAGGEFTQVRYRDEISPIEALSGRFDAETLAKVWPGDQRTQLEELAELRAEMDAA